MTELLELWAAPCQDGTVPPVFPLRVLVVDDQPQFRALLEVLLASDDRIELVGSARDGVQAVELARELQPDVVLMDIAMPRMDGFEATRAIRQEDPDAVIVMLTGSAANIDIDLARHSGASGYVTKSMLADLIDLVCSAAEYGWKGAPHGAAIAETSGS